MREIASDCWDGFDSGSLFRTEGKKNATAEDSRSLVSYVTYLSAYMNGAVYESDPIPTLKDGHINFFS